ncbi:hypothetical protein PR048_000184 [Dryococelus australis]|uniref:HTH psq-type domain-containing protein n=1 Tax=Dryococelus australis TaxID=614101 RepID=A0ABQ9IEI3_9NEOP|nr:hypothetical protein PR048_000184 [Dryococelus australis]
MFLFPLDARSPSPSSDSSTDAGKSNVGLGTKTHVWTQDDMCKALDALRNHELSLSRASAKYGIPSTTLWQRAHREGIDTPKKEGYFKSWTDENLKNALEMMRTGAMSANKASKVYSEWISSAVCTLMCCCEAQQRYLPVALVPG